MTLTARMLHDIASVAGTKNPALEPSHYEIYARYLNFLLPQYGITEKLEIAHFVAQTMHESGAYRFLEELGKPSRFTDRDNRPEYGHSKTGDGYRYRGRGLIQTTWLSNYKKAGETLGLDLVSCPEFLATPYYGTEASLIYWVDTGIKPHALSDNVEMVTQLVNGPKKHGLDERRLYTARAKEVLANHSAIRPTALATAPLEEGELAIINGCVEYHERGLSLPGDELYHLIARMASAI